MSDTQPETVTIAFPRRIKLIVLTALVNRAGVAAANAIDCSPNSSGQMRAAWAGQYKDLQTLIQELKRA